jgi:hypothetical protein
MLDTTSDTRSAPLGQVTTPPIADLLHHARVAAEMIESWSGDLDAVLGSIRFGHVVPDEVGDIAADAQAFLEITNVEIQAAIYELDAAISAAT